MAAPNIRRHHQPTANKNSKNKTRKPHKVVKGHRKPGLTSKNGRGVKYNSIKADKGIKNAIAKSGSGLVTLDNSEALVNARRKEKKKDKRAAYRDAVKQARKERGAAKSGMSVEEPEGERSSQDAEPEPSPKHGDSMMSSVDTTSIPTPKSSKKKQALKKLAKKMKAELDGDVDMGEA